jgi:NAD(P)H-flavin reductase
MYRFVVDELKKRGLHDENIFLSLERHMKCGMGKCGHCSIGGHFACLEGPVFSLAQLNFMQEVVECHGPSL